MLQRASTPDARRWPSITRDIPETVGPYRILEVLGQGGMGVVYRAEHVRTGEAVALKTVRRVSEGMLANIRREIHALSVIRHPGVVRIVAQGVSGGLPWYAMELLRERTLRDCLRDSVAGPEARRRLLGVIRRLCSPLAFLHGKGIVHRDLKPENVFVREDGTPVLVDFGLASHSFGTRGREVLEADGQLIGSALYMAPEQILGELVDARADLYALGCILYECATGSPPFKGPRVLYQHVKGPVVPPSVLADDVPRALEDLILHLLRKAPEERIGHALDVAAALSALGVPGAPAPDEPAAQTYLYRSAFVGREAVLERFRARIEQTLERRGGAVLVGGESGVGKTRLAMEAGVMAARRKLSVITCHCIPIGAEEGAAVKAGPLHPLGPFLLAVADRCREHGPAETERLLGARARILAPYEGSLAELPGGEGAPEPLELPAQAARQRLLECLRDTLLAFAEVQPTLLCIDDLQWADELTLSFLSLLLAGGLDARPALVVGTYRIEEVPAALSDLLASGAAERVTLERLDEGTVRQMVGGMLALRSVPEVVVEFLRRRSLGNPFFVAEYLRAAIGEGLLYRDASGAWRLRERALLSGSLERALSLPTSLAELIERRLLGLGAESRALLETAAVLGREFGGALLAIASALDETQEMEAIEELRMHQLLEEGEDGKIRFVHDKLREIAYGKIPQERRVVLHRSAAAAIEAHHGASPDFARFYPTLGHHWAQARVHDKAALCLMRAGDGARAAYANGEAIGFYRDALAELAELFDEEHEAPERWASVLARLYEALGDVLCLTGDHEGSREAYAKALARIEPGASLARARMHRKCGKTWEIQHRHEEALRAYGVAEAGLGAAPPERASREEAGAYWHEWVEIQASRAWVHYWLAQVDEMVSLVERVRPIVARYGTPRQRAQFLRSVTNMSVRRERYAPSDETVAVARAYLAASEESSDPTEIAMARFMLGFELLFHGDLDEAEEKLTAGLSDAERIGDVTLRTRCLNYLMMIQRRRGDVGATRRAAELCLSVAAASNMMDYAGASTACLSWVALSEGRADEAEALGEAAVELWRQLSLVYPYPFQWLGHGPLLAVALERGRVRDAIAHARVMLEPTQQKLPAEVASAIEAAIGAFDRGEPDRSRERLAEALAAARRRGVF